MRLKGLNTKGPLSRERNKHCGFHSKKDDN